MYSNYTGKRTEWSPIYTSNHMSDFIYTKQDRFVNHKHNYRLTSDDMKSTYQLIIKVTIFKKHKK